MWFFVHPVDVLFFRDNRTFAAGEGYRAQGANLPGPGTVAGALRSQILARELPAIGAGFDDFVRQQGGENPELLQELIQNIGSAVPGDVGRLRLKGPFLCRNHSACLGDDAKEGNGSLEVYLPTPRNLMGKARASGEDPTMYAEPAGPLRVAHRPWGFQQNGIGGTDLGEGGLTGDGFNSAAQKELGAAAVQSPVLAPLWVCSEEGAGEITGTMLAARHVRRFLTGTVSAGGYRHDADPVLIPLEATEPLYGKEARTGIQLQRGSRTAATGMLYTAEYLRMHDEKMGFLVHIEMAGDAKVHERYQPESGFIPLGGEQRAAWMEPVQLSGTDAGDELPGINDADTVRSVQRRLCEPDAGGRFFLYLLSPAIFRQGWLPDAIDRQTHRLRDGMEALAVRWEEGHGGSTMDGGSQAESFPALNGLDLRLVAAAVDKPQPLGGWSLAQQKPKPLRWAVPAGSIYYFEVIDRQTGAPVALSPVQAEAIMKLFYFQRTLQMASSAHSAQAHIGYGLTLVGCWNYVEPAL
ncbi:type III-B CRISPR module-associated Cmr3 family protein [Heliophilum fasciatum]|uniref:CRISPR type III-B/RAMP module-associated protein Cmr3 n=1 Tax=Heliophilum fasciatum TaxID=35700 RepID=A0A4R2RE78_9FIRM|nr:type III-B CRISPR module-associated Cmr3 family protein [Heliophilum fasciatum]MCW2279326.1 CRISPR type III-B/RAMP module-associated protein Cmr3 [Heliophilum fasciatum]TCP60307.1 CRISPR type III-B/RAMP module-associated protein Cmr3 [Heliophilum fasciatum]